MIPESPKKVLSGSIFLLLLLCYFALHVLLRTLLSSTLDLDEAEQALLAQWLLSGYTEQPPLYTWVQYLFFEIFGKGILAISLLKNTLLFVTYLFVYLSGLRIFKNIPVAIMATISLLTIPQICWESQRDMTHTVLVVCASAATLYQVLRTADSPGRINYFLLGLCCAAGVLGKANYLLFFTAVLLTLFSTHEGRRMIFHRRILLTLVTLLLASGSYLWWMYHNQDIIFASTYKFQRELITSWTTGPVNLAITTIYFLFPCWLFWLLLFPEGFKIKRVVSADFETRFIRYYLPLCLTITLFVIVAFKINYVKDRWLQPLLFATPLWFFSRINSSKISPGKFQCYAVCGIFAAIILYSSAVLRITAAGKFDSFSRINYPFTQIAQAIRQQGFSQGLILTDKRFLAGNMVIHFPESTAIIPDYRFEKLPLKKQYNSILVLWIKTAEENIPGKLALFLKEKYNIEAASLKTRDIINPYLYATKDTQQTKLGMAITTLPKKTEESDQTEHLQASRL